MAHSRSLAASLTAAALLFTLSLSAACRREGAAPSPPKTAAQFERATAGMNRTQTAKYVLAAYQCGRCHTVDDRGYMGFTAAGDAAREQIACCKGGTMCVRLLSVANTLATVPERDRSPDEQKMFQAFSDFGCAFCHRIEAGKMAFTDIGVKLGFMHANCVEIQQGAKTGM